MSAELSAATGQAAQGAAAVPLPGAIGRQRAPARRRASDEWLAWDRGDLVKTNVAAAVSSAALTTMVLVSVILVSLASAHPSWLSPTARVGDYPRWLAGPLGPLTSWLTLSTASVEAVFTVAVATMYVAYVVVLICAPRMRPGWALATVVLLQLIYFVSPPLPLTDVFNYLNYGRMEIVHGLNPYTTIPALEPHNDPTFALSNWHGLLSPYGPLFTVITFAPVWLGVAASFWALKALLLLTSLATVWLMWSSAAVLGRHRLAAALFLGLNPIVLVWGLGADHNDFLMIFLIVLAMYLLVRVRAQRQATAPASGGAPAPATAAPRRASTPLRGRIGAAISWIDGAPAVASLTPSRLWWEFGAGVALAGSVAIKASAAILIPVMLAGSRRRLAIASGIAVGLIGFGAMTLVAFGPNLPNLSQQDALVIPSGIPNLTGYALGLGGVTGGVRAAFDLVLVAAVGVCTVWAWRTRDWLTPCAYATLALLLSLSWALPWYLIWLLPFAALTKSRGMRVTVLVLGVYMFLSWMPYASSLERKIGLNPRTTNVGRSAERYLHTLLY